MVDATTLRSSAARRLGGAVRRSARACGFELVRRHYYSPIPFDTPREAWNRRSPLTGLEFDVDAQIEWFERVTKHVSGWTPPVSEMLGPIDADVLYGAIKELSPRRVVELGSGTSSEIISRALGRPHEIYDPVPNERTTLPVNRVSATDVPLDVFRGLEAGDVLFVDTTHTVKTGGDVNRIVLDYLPILAPGVVVHIHDVFLPFEYPYEWALEGRLWAEQYLVQAFLIGNPAWRVLCCNMAVTVDHRDRVAAAVPRFSEASGPPASFWMQRQT